MEVDIQLQKLEYGVSASLVSSKKFFDSEHPSFGKFLLQSRCCHCSYRVGMVSKQKVLKCLLGQLKGIG